MTLLLTHPTAVVATAIDDRRTDRGWRRVHRLGKGNERRAPRPADVGPASPSSLRRRVRRGADISSRDAPTDISRPMPSLGHVLIRVSLPVSSPALWGAVTVSDGNSLLPPDRRAASSRQAGDGGRDRARTCSAACVRETARDAAGWVRLSEFGGVLRARADAPAKRRCNCRRGASSDATPEAPGPT